MELTKDNYDYLKALKLKRSEIADRFNIPEWKLKKHISNNGWGKVLPTISNPTAFSKYCKTSAYWAGFIAADGNVDSKNRVRLMLKYDDLGHLEKLRTFLGSTHAISANTDKYYRCSFELTSKRIVQDLQEYYNIIPNKTLSMEFPFQIPSVFWKDFIRGYFDGDGSLCESFSNKNSITSSLYATFSGGCPDYLEAIFEILKEELQLSGTIQDFKGNNNRYQIKYNTNDAKKLAEWMYKDSLDYLDRKFKIYINLIVNDNRKTRILR